MGGIGQRGFLRVAKARHEDLNLARRGVAVGAAVLAALLGGCGGSDDPSLAQTSGVQVSAATAASSPFIGHVRLVNASVQDIASVAVTVEPKSGATAAPAHYTYQSSYIARRGWADAAQGQLALPVPALYAGTTNHVDLHVAFRDGSATDLAASIDTPAYVDLGGIYDHPVAHVPRDASLQPGFSYFFMKTHSGSPIVVDVDGQVRWSLPSTLNSQSSIFTDNGFVVGDPTTVSLVRMELDGSVQTTPIESGHEYINIHHNIDAGKRAMFVSLDAESNGQKNLESVFAEVSPSGAVLKQWDMAQILSDYMRSQGDDPSNFVRPGIDWFHQNATAYDPSDDSIIVSSRENFLIKIDYASGSIKWILGDPSQYWAQYASLRAKSLVLGAGGLSPLGQHAVSVVGKNQVMVFNDGTPSIEPPAGWTVGPARTYSAVSSYAVDPEQGTATETGRFDYVRSLYSAFCSSAYRTSNGGMLISYAAVGGGTHTRLVGLDPQQRVAFDYEYVNRANCDTSWNAQVIPLEALTFQ